MSERPSHEISRSRLIDHVSFHDEELPLTPKYEQHERFVKYRPRIWLLSTVASLLTISLIFLFTGIHQYFPLYHPADSGIRTSCSCGTSVASAMALGCKYDTLAASWFPDSCRDDELAAEFDAAGPGGKWTYWSDRNQTVALTIKEVSMLPDTTGCFWATQRWHLLHCSFYWKKLHRSKFTGVQMEKHYDGIGHINYCEQLFLDSGDLEEVKTEASVGLDGDKLVLPSGGCAAIRENS